MSRTTREVFKFILKLIYNKSSFVLWFFIRFISATFPLFSIYLFSRVVSLLEQGADFHRIIIILIFAFLVLILDNLTRLLSINQLDFIISNTEFSIHQFLLIDLKAKNRKQRFHAIQAIRNFSEAVRTTLEIIRQPGIDSLVSLISIPLILIILDFKVFVLEISYIIVYYFVDVFTTEKYIHLKDIQNTHTENYFGKLQESNEIEAEQRQYTRQYQKLCQWSFIEWFTLQNVAVIFYSVTILYLAYEVTNHTKQISDFVLLAGYVTSTQTYLNSLSIIKDRLADTKVALFRLTKNKRVSSPVDLSDLVR